MSTPTPGPKRAVWKYVGGLAPGVIVWVVLVGWLAYLLYARAEWSEEADRATVREWVEEARTFRKALPELVREYVRLRDEMYAAGPGDRVAADRAAEKRDEIREQLLALAEPTRAYMGQLPSFPVVYSIEVLVSPPPGFPESAADRIVWDTPLPRPRQQNEHGLRTIESTPLGEGNRRAVIRCEYQLHAFNKLQRREEERQRISLVAGAVLVAATLLAALGVTRFLARERQRDIEGYRVQTIAEQREREVLEVRLRQQEAERARDDLDRKLLEEKLVAADLRERADDAEKSALEMKSQLYASIGIMAGSYAHNIKNLLVRPNDLLSRCLEADGMTRDQAGMLQEVRSTLGTVTERLQQILRTIRRDPNNAELARLDLGQLVRETAQTWGEIGRDKWKVIIAASVPDGPLPVNADLSHLQQAVENLVFNARDATFEMRNRLRELARTADPAARKQKLIEAAAWKGEVTLTARRDGDYAVLEVRDNGIGMTDEVRANCLKTHFTTKRDNALYSGYSAGMGLGLSFVAVVLEHHKAELTIASEPLMGATFIVRFPVAS
jgi:signal transduction histidine kinase